MMGSIEFGFRWIHDITIELTGERPNSDFQLKVSADTGKKKFLIRKCNEQVLRRVSNEKIPCNKKEAIEVELFEYRHQSRFRTKKVQILSRKIVLESDVIHLKKTDTDNFGISITLEFSYTTGGELRGQVENARIITDQQKMVLEKIKRTHVFFEYLEGISSTIKEIHPYIEGGCSALLLIYKLCERYRECCEAAQSLVDEMDDLLKYGVERLGGILKESTNTKTAFKSIKEVIVEISGFIREQSKRVVGGLRDALSPGHKKKIDELREKFKRAKAGLNDSITYGLWELAVDDHLRNDLKFVSNAYYQRGAGCLTGTRVELLAGVDMWVRDPNAEKMAWIHGYAGSGKSALLNSIARNMEKAYIPFTCFTCKRDDAERSDVQRILSTICYGFTRNYDDYRGTISNTVKQQEGLSITTGDVATQMELLFGESPSYELISPRHARRPPVHVLLIDALDECKNIRERSALARHLRELANQVPWIKVIITSRRESDIVDVLADSDNTQSIHIVNINDKIWKTSDDIALFIEAQSVKLKLDLSPSQIEGFQEKASGLFIWCSTVFRYIEKSKRGNKDIVDDILTSSSSWFGAKEGPFDSLYALYRRIFDSAVTNLDDKLKMEIILGVVFVASTHQPLSANAIAEILYPNERSDKEKVWVNNIIESLFAIIDVEDGTSVVRTCHPSVLDFIREMLTMTIVLGENMVAPFSARLGDIHARVFKGCFTIMEQHLRFNICGLEDSFLLNSDISDLPARIKQNISEALRYGCLFWVSHLELSSLREHCGQVFEFLYSPNALFWIEVLSLLDAVDRGIIALQDCVYFFTETPSVAHIASEWERFLSAYGEALKSTPHLYLSALSWIPKTSPLWEIVYRTFSSELPVISRVLETWTSERWSESVGSAVRSVAYSFDGRLFVAGCSDGSVRFWEARSRKKEREPFTTESEVWSITFSPDNLWLASGHDDGNIRVWDLRDVSPIPRVLEGRTSMISSLTFSWDGKRIASGPFDKYIRVWDVESAIAIGEPLEGHEFWISSVAFSADDTRIISGSGDKTVRIWNVETGQQIGEPLQGHSDWVTSIACSRDGRFIASGSTDGSIILWDAQTYERIGDLAGYTGWVYSICFSVDGRHIVSGCDDHSVRAWNVDTRSIVNELKGHTNHVNTVSISPNGRNILSGSWDGTVRVWDIEETALVDRPSAGDVTEIFCISYVLGINCIVSGSKDGSLNLWDAHTGVRVRTLTQGHTNAVRALAVSGDGHWLVSESDIGTLRIWDLASGSTRGDLMLGKNEMVHSIAISPDNKLIAFASDDWMVHLWDAETRIPAKTLGAHASRVTSVTFSVDGNSIISGSYDSTISIWNTHTGDAVGEPLRGHSDRVLVVAVSPNGQWIASGSMDNTVRIWSMATLSEIHVLEGHSDWVWSVSFSPDSQHLVSGSRDRTIRVWNVRTGNAIGNPFKGHIYDVRSIAFGPNEYEFASSSRDGTIRVWDVRARTDLEMQEEDESDYNELDEDRLRIRWNASRACAPESSGWIKDQEKLLLWVPWQYRHDIYSGTRLAIGARDSRPIRPQVDYRKMFRYSGTRWKDVYTSKVLPRDKLTRR